MSASRRRGRPRASAVMGPMGRRRLKISRTGLHEQAAERLRRLIIRGDLAPGTQLVEAEISERLNVSRTPLREALKLLAAEGLVELRRNRSACVRPMRPDEITELFEAVGGIERLAAELAAVRITPRELHRLRLLQHSMERHHAHGTLDDYFAFNQQIHRLIVAAAKNAPLREAHDWLLARAERARYLALGFNGRWDESIAEHRAILKALEERDVERAGSCLAKHVTRTGEAVNAILQQERPAARESLGEPVS